MRNVFDQYSQHENRLTHALLCCLYQDRKLLERFVFWATGKRIAGKFSKLYEQSWPGDAPLADDKILERTGLPDGCIQDKDGWLLLLECKFSARLTSDQINRHIRTAERRGYENATVLILTAVEENLRWHSGVYVKKWSEVYSWMTRQKISSKWAETFLEYMEVAEVRAVNDNYLKQGGLTVFSGVPFSTDEPYGYLQAKRILGLLRSELLQDKRLQKTLCIDPNNQGRGAITGRDGSGVWDYLSPKWPGPSRPFTAYPHFTLGINADHVDVYVTIPNGVRNEFRKNLLGKSFEDFEKVVLNVSQGIERTLRGIDGAKPMIVLVQRHYKTQRSAASLDCLLRFDPRTAYKNWKGSPSRIKCQPQWLKAAYDALENRKSNLQFQIGAEFKYVDSSVVRRRELKDAIAGIWLACKPLVSVRAQ